MADLVLALIVVGLILVLFGQLIGSQKTSDSDYRLCVYDIAGGFLILLGIIVLIGWRIDLLARGLFG